MTIINYDGCIIFICFFSSLLSKMIKTALVLISPILNFIIAFTVIIYCWIFSFSSINNGVKDTISDNTHILVRSLILRSLGFLYIIIFSTALYQYDGLWADQGILPVSKYMELLFKQANKRSQHWFGAFLLDTPTLLWFFDINKSSIILKLSLYIGLILSFMVLLGSNHYVLLLTLWFIKLSLVNVGQQFMLFGWHPQMLEFAFLCIFLGDWSISFNNHKNPSFLIIFLLRCLIFRVMFEPGLGKILGGDSSWWPDCNAMIYHVCDSLLFQVLMSHTVYNKYCHISTSETITNLHKSIGHNHHAMQCLFICIIYRIIF